MRHIGLRFTNNFGGSMIATDKLALMVISHGENWVAPDFSPAKPGATQRQLQPPTVVSKKPVCLECFR